MKVGVITLGLLALFIIGTTVFQGRISPPLPRTALETIPFHHNCPAPVRGELLLESVAITPEALDRSALELAREQHKYLNGYFNFTDEASKRFVLLAGSTIDILEEKRTTYPHTLPLDPEPRDGASATLARKIIRKNMPALEVRYRLRQPVIVCRKNTADATMPTVRLPRDPFLAYWYVPKASRVELSFHGKKYPVNPCSHDHMADLRHPTLFWYYWKPGRTQPFDCPRFLDEGKYVEKVSFSFTEQSERHEPLSFRNVIGSSGEIRIALIAGFIEAGKLPQSLVRARDVLAEPDLLKKLTGTPQEIRTLLQGQDPGTGSTLLTLRELAGAAHLKALIVTPVGASWLLTAKGSLKQSRRDFELKVFLGVSVDYMEGTRHWDFLVDALKSSSFIFYSGHADAGKSFRLERILSSVEGSELPPYQFLGILSCFSAFHFGDDYLALRDKAGLVTDLLVLGYEGYAFLLPVSVVKALDRDLSGLHPGLGNELSRIVGPRDDVHLWRVRR